MLFFRRKKKKAETEPSDSDAPALESDELGAREPVDLVEPSASSEPSGITGPAEDDFSVDEALPFDLEMPEAGASDTLPELEPDSGESTGGGDPEPDILDELEALHEGEGEDDAEEKPRKRGFFGRIRSALSRTRGVIAEAIPTGRKIDENVIDDLEMLLLTADVGVDASEKLVNGLHGRGGPAWLAVRLC